MNFLTGKWHLMTQTSYLLIRSNIQMNFPWQTNILLTGWLHLSRSVIWQQQTTCIIQHESIHHCRERASEKLHVCTPLFVSVMYYMSLTSKGTLDRPTCFVLSTAAHSFQEMFAESFPAFSGWGSLCFEGLSLCRHWLLNMTDSTKEKMNLHFICSPIGLSERDISRSQAQNNKDLK